MTERKNESGHEFYVPNPGTTMKHRCVAHLYRMVLLNSSNSTQLTIFAADGTKKITALQRHKNLFQCAGTPDRHAGQVAGFFQKQ